ncbi:MAG: thermostable hemolysin [Candidatus Azotimanducaceae bacterium WSBS_2022_MAG_OTU7]
MIFEHRASDLVSLVIWKCLVVLPVVDDQRDGTILATNESECYPALCEFTKVQFERRFSSRLEQFYPLILSYWANSEIQAVVGFRPAKNGPLFLERYLPGPTEVLLDLDRGSIVELGGFAALSRAAALPLMRAAAGSLQALGFTTAVCTANAPIRGCLKKLGIEFSEIGTANPELVGESAESWGSYYKSAPKVIAGDIATSIEAMTRLFGATA